MKQNTASTDAEYIENATGLPARAVQLYRGDDGWVTFVDVEDHDDASPLVVRVDGWDDGVYNVEVYGQTDVEIVDSIDSVAAVINRRWASATTRPGSYL